MEISSVNVIAQTPAGPINPKSVGSHPDPAPSVDASLRPASVDQLPDNTEATASEAPEAQTSNSLEDSLQYMNKLMQSLNNSLQFSLDEDTGKTVVKIIDLNTKETIKQMPSEEALALTKALDKLKGLFVQQKV